MNTFIRALGWLLAMILLPIMGVGIWMPVVRNVPNWELIPLTLLMGVIAVGITLSSATGWVEAYDRFCCLFDQDRAVDRAVQRTTDQLWHAHVRTIDSGYGVRTPSPPSQRPEAAAFVQRCATILKAHHALPQHVPKVVEQLLKHLPRTTWTTASQSCEIIRTSDVEWMNTETAVVDRYEVLEAPDPEMVSSSLVTPLALRALQPNKSNHS